MLQPGQKLLQWTIVERLGGGAFGEVFKIKDNDGNIYALKTEKVNADNNVGRRE
jgi:hypothetical protein